MALMCINCTLTNVKIKILISHIDLEGETWCERDMSP